MKTLGIIGFGEFGKLAARELRDRFAVGAHDSNLEPQDITAQGVMPLSLQAAAASDIVLITVPVQAMEDVIAAVAPLVRPGATVLDVASVKMLPSRWLALHMPETVHVVPTHPLFGPQSAAQGVAGRQLVICPLRGDQHLKVAQVGAEMGMRVRITTADEHDREMAFVQALTHLIGRSLSAMNIPDEMLKTQSYQHLLDLCGLIGNDSFELFTAIQTLNPFAREVTEDFVARAGDLLHHAYEGAKRD